MPLPLSLEGKLNYYRDPQRGFDEKCNERWKWKIDEDGGGGGGVGGGNGGRQKMRYHKQLNTDTVRNALLRKKVISRSGNDSETTSVRGWIEWLIAIFAA